MIRAALVLAGMLALAGCDASFGGPPLISGQSPPNQSSRSEPEPPNSLPPGFAGIGRGPNATAPDYGSITLSPAR